MEIKESTELKYRENTGSVTANLRAMQIGLQYAINVPHGDAQNIRGLITNIHKGLGENAGYRFRTEKIDTGIKVWRLA